MCSGIYLKLLDWAIYADGAAMATRSPRLHTGEEDSEEDIDKALGIL